MPIYKYVSEVNKIFPVTVLDMKNIESNGIYDLKSKSYTDVLQFNDIYPN